ncbi:MAG: 16S rRNA (uracil(1498)-N(3))-methyltransferase [Hyphomicrobiaceae bacterium]
MAIHDFSSQRLFVEPPLAQAAEIVCEGQQANYLLNVLRLREGDRLRVFNGRDGEWDAQLRDVRKRDCRFVVGACVRPQTAGPDVEYLFAPLKHARLDYMVQKAVEMGVRCLRPVITRRTVAERVNLDRMRANVIEAAEQCGILHVAEVAAPVKFDAVLAGWDVTRKLVFCDEEAETGSAVTQLHELPEGAPVAVLIGPEGGFDPAERSALLRQPYTLAVSLGPRIMRADTAAVAALALVNAVHGRGW